MILNHGKSFHYVTVLSEVLGFIIANIEDMPLHDVFAQRIWQKIVECLIGADRNGNGLVGAG